MQPVFRKSRIPKDNDARIKKKLIDFMDERYPWCSFVKSSTSYSTRRYDFKINEPDFGAENRIFRELAAKLDIVMDVNNCSVCKNGSFMVINVPRKDKDKLRLGNGVEMLLSEDKVPIKCYLGEVDDGSPAFIDFSSTHHLLIGGTTGSGKSTVMHDIILSLMAKYSKDDIQFYIIDRKNELSIYKDCPHVRKMAVTQGEIESLVNSVNEELIRRNEIMNGYDSPEEYYKHTKNKLPELFVIFDEANYVIGKDSGLQISDKVRAIFKNTSDVGRSRGIHVIMASLRPAKANIDTNIKSNIPDRLALRVADAIDSKLILGMKGAEKLTGDGDAILLLNSAPYRIQCAYTDPDERRKAIKALCK